MSNRLEECKVGGVVEAGRRAEAKPHKECFSFALGIPDFNQSVRVQLNVSALDNCSWRFWCPE